MCNLESLILKVILTLGFGNGAEDSSRYGYRNETESYGSNGNS